MSELSDFYLIVNMIEINTDAQENLRCGVPIDKAPKYKANGVLQIQLVTLYIYH